MGEYLFLGNGPPPDDYLKMTMCIMLGITESQYDAEDIGTWRKWQQMLSIEASYGKRLRWER